MDTDTLSVIRSFFKAHTDIEPERIVPEAVLQEGLGIDSLMLLELMFECEDSLQIEIPEDIPVPKTVGDLMAIIARVQAQAPAPASAATAGQE